MNSDAALSAQKIDQARDKICAALQRGGQDGATVDALQSSLSLLNSLTSAPQRDTAQHDGAIDYTFDDGDYQPHGRQVDVRIHFAWDDYNPADEPFAVWGARIEDVQVLAIRYYNDEGNEVDAATHHVDLAWDLIEKNRTAITERCTEEGYRQGLGEADPLYAPLPTWPPAAAAPRMAPSARERHGRSEHRKFG